MLNFLTERRKQLALEEENNLNDNVPTPEQVNKASGEIDKELDSVKTEEPKEPKEDFLTQEEAAKRIRGKVKAKIEDDFRVSLVTPSTDPEIVDGSYSESFVVGKYVSPGGIFESSKPSIFEVSATWDEDEQLTEMNADVKLKLRIENNEYAIPLKAIPFSIKL